MGRERTVHFPLRDLFKPTDWRDVALSSASRFVPTRGDAAFRGSGWVGGISAGASSTLTRGASSSTPAEMALGGGELDPRVTPLVMTIAPWISTPPLPEIVSSSEDVLPSRLGPDLTPAVEVRFPAGGTKKETGP